VIDLGCVTPAVDTHNLKRKIAMPVGHEQAYWSDSKLVNLFAPGVLLVDRLEPPCSDDLFAHCESVFVSARRSFGSPRSV